MLSDQFYKLLIALTKILAIIPVSHIRFNRKTKKLYCCTSKAFQVKIYATCLLMAGWFTGMCFKVFYRYKQKDYSGTHLALCMLYGSTISTFLFSINAFFSREICQTTNGILTLLQHMHCKYFYFKNFN